MQEYYTPFGFTSNLQTIEDIKKYAGWKQEGENWIALADKFIEKRSKESQCVIVTDWRNKYVTRTIKAFQELMEGLDKYPNDIQSFEALIKGVNIGSDFWQIKLITKGDYIKSRNTKSSYQLEDPSNALSLTFAQNELRRPKSDQ